MKWGGAKEAFDLLAAKYGGTAYVVLPQVANGTGHEAGRWLDAVVVSLWPSRGLWLHGYEIKCSRGDWLRELKQGEKADAFHKHLDFFSILTVGPVIEAGELPESWGHVEANFVKKKLVVVKDAPRISPPNKCIDRALAMGLFRNFDKSCVDGIIQARVKDEYDRGVKIGRESAEYKQQSAQSAALQNQKFLDAFQAAHGLDAFALHIDIAEKLGLMVKAFSRLDRYNRIADLCGQLRYAAEALTIMGSLPRSTE